MRRILLACVALATVSIGCSAEEANTPSRSGDAPSQELASAPFGETTEGTPQVDEDPAREAALLGVTGTGEEEETPVDPGSNPTPTAPTTPPPATPTGPNPGPKPTGTCSVTKDADGFFVRSSGKSDYVAYVPASYSASAPMRAIVGMHGCGDTAGNFARWGINPVATRATQDHIGISVGGESGNNRCWRMGGDDEKVLAAVDDLSRCFWIHQAKVVVAGFSSGGQLAYRVGLAHADRFAGILVEHASLYAAGNDPDGLLAGAAWKVNIAHRAATNDSVFPIAKVKADWAKTNAAGFPLTTSELAGGHDGDSDDWASFLLPASAAWTKP